MSATVLGLITGRHTHRVKSWPDNFAAVVAGRKTFEIRRDDRAPPYTCGDLIELQEWRPPSEGEPEPSQVYGFTGRRSLHLIGYVSRGPTVAPGWCAFELINIEAALRVMAAILKQP